MQSYFERYRFQEFAWFPAGSVAKAKEHMGYRAAALHMSNAFNTQEQLKELLDEMHKTQCVKALFIPENQVGDAGCEMMGDFLRKDRTLKYLFLENNNISTRGLEAIVDGLRENKTLKTLMIGANEIDDDGAKALAELIRDSEHLREIAIGRNISDTGALYLAKGLNHNNSLKAIYLLNNKIKSLGARVLAEVVSRHPSCDNVEVVSEDITLEKFQEMLKGLAEVEMKKAFETAVRNNEEGPWLRSKIMVVGQGRAGKTATVRSLLGLNFDPNLDSTVGASISQSTTKNSNNQWNKVSENAKVDFMLDTASRITALKLARKRNEDAQAMENFNIEEFAKWYQDKEEAEKEETRQLEEKRKREAAMNTGAVLSEEEIATSFKAELITNKNAELEDISFTIWDYGGQQVFYTLHHLFLTRYGIYLLAFDMRDVVCKDMKDEEKTEKLKQTTDYLLFWLNSVYMHAAEAPLLIIGTFLDMVNKPDELKEVNDFIKNLVENKFEQVVRNHDMFFFPMNNRHPTDDISSLVEPLGGHFGRNVEIIRDTIEKVARAEEFVNQKLSLRWMKTLDRMLGEPESYLKLHRVREIAAEVGIKSVNEVDNMLQFFHELGMIVHLTSTQNLREIVTTKPQWLVDALSKVIRDEKLHKFDEEKVKQAGLIQDMEEMFTHSIVTSDWLEFLWPKEQVNFLIDLMRRTMLISDWKFGRHAKETAYLVPSLINHADPERDREAELMLKPFSEKVKVGEGDEAEEVPAKKAYFSKDDNVNGIVFDFSKSFLPQGVFQRLMCLCVFHAARENKKPEDGDDHQPELYQNSAEIYMGGVQSFKLYKYDVQILCKVYKSAEARRNQTPLDPMKAYKMLVSMLRKLKVDVMGKGLEWDVYFETVETAGGKEVTNKAGQKSHMFIPYEEAKANGVAPWFEPVPGAKVSTSATPEKQDEPGVPGVDLEQFLVDLGAL